MQLPFILSSLFKRRQVTLKPSSNHASAWQTLEVI